ncbi:MAG: L-rhamnose mutarotase [Candidatus Humimicrobiaceae bacterium]
MKKYCMIFKIKKEFVKDYAEIHKNAWIEQVNAIKDS